mgnify:CR=1 FL=1
MVQGELLKMLEARGPVTTLMVTHDLAEAFKLGTRLIVFDKVRPDDPSCSATITYDLPLRGQASDVAPEDIIDKIGPQQEERPHA